MPGLANRAGAGACPYNKRQASFLPLIWSLTGPTVVAARAYTWYDYPNKYRYLFPSSQRSGLVTGEQHMRGTSSDEASGPAVASSGELTGAVERLRAEAQAREAETQYQVIFEATTDGLVINDEAGIAVE